MQPGRYTELFFLDEATALAAGHRPCAECRRADYDRFVALWRELHRADSGADAIDARLHAERLDPATRGARLHDARLDELPDGAFVLDGGAPRLVLGRELLAWTPAGYTSRSPRPRRTGAIADHAAVARRRPACRLAARGAVPAPVRVGSACDRRRTRLLAAVTAEPPDRELEEIVGRALEELPRQFRDQIANLAVVVEDEPPEGKPWLAIYEGVPLPRRSVFQGWMWPSKITIYRGPLRRLYGGDPERFEREVTHVVHHELAHYFGISDQRLIEIDRY